VAEADPKPIVAAEPPYPPAGVGWSTVAVLLIAYVFSFADRQILSLLVGPIKADLRINDTQFSLLSGFAFAIFYTVLGLPFGRLADRYSRRRIIAIGAALWSAATVACGFARSYAALFAARVGVGVGEASLGPAAFSMMSDLFPPERRARAFSVYSLGIYIGAGLALVFGGLIVGAVSSTPTIELPFVGEVASWHAAFILIGAPGLLLPVFLYLVPEPARRGRATVATTRGPGLRETLSHVWGHRALFGPFLLGFALMVLAGFATLAWAPEMFIRTYGSNPAEAGTSIGLTMVAAGSAGVLAGGWFADRLLARGRRDAVLIGGVVSALAGVIPAIAFPLMPTAGAALALLALVFFFGAFVSGAAPSALPAVVPNEMRGQVSAIYLLAINLIGIGFGPLLPALLTDFAFGDPAALRYALAIVGGAAGLIAAALLQRARAPYRAAVSV